MNKSNRGPGGGILGHHFDKRLESVASQALLYTVLPDFTENLNLL
jgi:hypothetical protein